MNGTHQRVALAWHDINCQTGVDCGHRMGHATVMANTDPTITSLLSRIQDLEQASTVAWADHARLFIAPPWPHHDDEDEL